MDIITRASLYITRYAPSEKRLLEYLAKKKVTDPRAVLESVWYHESLMLRAWIDTYISRRIHIAKIRNNLIRKGFPRESIDAMIEEYAWEWDSWDMYRDFILSEGSRMIGKWKSAGLIRHVLTARYPHFHEEICELFSSYDDTDAFDSIAKKYASRYSLTHPKERNRFIMALARRWFNIAKIRNWIKSSISL